MIKTLVLEPLPERGARIRVCEKGVWKAEAIVGPAEDIVLALARHTRALVGVKQIVVRSKIGSFSASRGCYVVGTTLSATRGIPLIVVDANLDTPEELEEAITNPLSAFDYQRPPHIYGIS